MNIKSISFNWTLNLIITLSLLIINGCRSDKPIQGPDLADPDNRGKVRFTISTSDLEESFSDIATTGRSIYLSLGSFKNIETRILLRFDNIPDSVTAATITLIPHAIVGDSSGSFTATVHQILTDWDEPTVTDSNFVNMFEPNPIGSAEVFPTVSKIVDSLSTTDTLRIEIDAEVVNTWIDSTANKGVLINFSNDGFIKEFFSRENASNRPQLEIQFAENGSALDTTLTVRADAYLVRSLADPPPEPLYVGNAIRHQSVIEFDLTNIQREATINKAILKLNAQEENSLLKDDGILLEFLRLKEPFEDHDSIRLDSSLVIRPISSFGGSDSLNIQVFVQEWISERFENNGFIIRPQAPGRDVSRVAFYSTEIDTSLAPKLKIDFTLPPAGP